MKVIGLDIGRSNSRYAIIDGDNINVIHGPLEMKKISSLPALLDYLCKDYPDIKVWVDTVGIGNAAYNILINSPSYANRVNGVRIGLDEIPYDDLYQGFKDWVRSSPELSYLPDTDPDHKYKFMIVAFYGYIVSMRIGIDVSNDHIHVSKA